MQLRNDKIDVRNFVATAFLAASDTNMRRAGGPNRFYLTGLDESLS